MGLRPGLGLGGNTHALEVFTVNGQDAVEDGLTLRLGLIIGVVQSAIVALALSGGFTIIERLSEGTILLYDQHASERVLSKFKMRRDQLSRSATNYVYRFAPLKGVVGCLRAAKDERGSVESVGRCQPDLSYSSQRIQYAEGVGYNPVD